MVTHLKEINFGVPQNSVLGPVLYLLYTIDLPVALDSTTATYADDTAVLAAHNNHIEASSITGKSSSYPELKNGLKNGESKPI